MQLGLNKNGQRAGVHMRNPVYDKRNVPKNHPWRAGFGSKQSLANSIKSGFIVEYGRNSRTDG